MASITYYWDEVGDNVFMEEDENGDSIAHYTHEPGLGGELIAQRRAGRTNFYNFDGQRSTRELTNEDEDITDTYTYTVFGEEVAKSGTTVNPFGFRGALAYYTDHESGVVFVKQRAYKPTLGRFISQSRPDGVERGSYRFGGNSPANAVGLRGFQEAPEEEEDERPRVTYQGCTDEERQAIDDAGRRVCGKNKGALQKCLDKGSDLRKCMGTLCLDSPLLFICQKCEDDIEGEGGQAVIINELISDRIYANPCRIRYADRQRLIVFCRGENGKIPHEGYSLDEILLHELLHHCGLTHNEDDPQWEKDIFGACIKKCLKGQGPDGEDLYPDGKYDGEDEAKCKCRC